MEEEKKVWFEQLVEDLAEGTKDRVEEIVNEYLTKLKYEEADEQRRAEIAYLIDDQLSKGVAKGAFKAIEKITKEQKEDFFAHRR